jgi:uncharacterized protein
MDANWIRERTGGSCAFIPVVHLEPLPGAPLGSPGLDRVWERARDEISQFREAGADGIILENHGDAPFAATENPPETRAAMALIAARSREIFDGMLGVNLLRNDAAGAFAAALVAKADFIRVNIWTGVTATDQGIIEGPAREVLRARRAADSQIAIAADIDVKFGEPIFRAPHGAWARATLQRGGADLIVASGVATGAPTDPDLLAELRQALGPSGPILVGSGATEDELHSLLAHADGVIVGSTLKEDGYVENPVCPHRLAAFARAFREASEAHRHPRGP